MRLGVMLAVLAIRTLIAANQPEADVRQVLDQQVQCWNRGDLDGFVRTYSTETLFVGKEITRGSDQVLARYRRNYPTRERMGTLTFSALEVRMLGSDYASVVGRFQLRRTQANGGDAEGVFTLLLKRSGSAWTIIVDHTS